MIFSDWPWRHWRQVRGETIALRLNDEQLNWRELCARVDELASGFAVQGVVEVSYNSFTKRFYSYNSIWSFSKHFFSFISYC